MTLPTKCLGFRHLLHLCLFIFIFISCKKEINRDSSPDLQNLIVGNSGSGHLQQTKTFFSDVVIQWVGLQVDMLRTPLAPGTGAAGADRAQAYCGIALYEAVVNGMPAYRSLSGQLTDFPEMPHTEPGKAYHWAASANAALADMNRKYFTTTAASFKTKMDLLENTFQAQYASEVDAETLQRSIAYGKEVAAKVFVWSTSDGSANVNPPYTPPVGPGLWVPTVSSPPTNPYAIQRRLLVPGVANGIDLVPPVYSANTASPFFAMAKDVYDKSQVLTQAQIDLAMYYRDAPGLPGFPGAGHFVALFSQILGKAAPQLDVAALAYAKSGIGLIDGLNICFINKYRYNVLRPITFIRNEMGNATWSPLFGTPNHPEFPSAHSTNAGTFLTMLSDVFGENFHFTENTYEYMGLPNRTYHTFSELKKAIGDSRVYGGIHYQETCDKSAWLGEKISQNILNNVKFHKE